MLVQRIPWLFRVASVVEYLDCGGRTIMGPVLHHPNDLFVTGHFHQLGALMITPAGANDGVAIVEAGDRLGIAVPVL